MSSIVSEDIRRMSGRGLCGLAAAFAGVAAVVAVASPAQAASSPSVVGQKYSDAKGALASAGYTEVVETTVGDQLQRDDCIVSRQQDRTVPPPENTSAAPTKQTMLSLNCDAAVASATKPGNSLASPAGAAAAAAAKASATATPSPTPSSGH
jgi:hypothetical protein